MIEMIFHLFLIDFLSVISCSTFTWSLNTKGCFAYQRESIAHSDEQNYTSNTPDHLVKSPSIRYDIVRCDTFQIQGSTVTKQLSSCARHLTRLRRTCRTSSCWTVKSCTRVSPSCATPGTLPGRTRTNVSTIPIFLGFVWADCIPILDPITWQILQHHTWATASPHPTYQWFEPSLPLK